MRNQTLMKDIGLNLLNEGKTIRIKAHGYSMYPCIKPGSVILIEPIHLKGIPVTGEIIALQRENGLIVHRLTRIVVNNGTRMYIARGDSNSSDDDPVTIDKIAGRIVGAETSGENPVRADISINKSPDYISNRIRVIWIHIITKIKRLT